ncbi:HNH endonuclease [Pseudarthrobacter sp. R1]|uniref:HNH endonuclease n=1 Tax=Pseudarthrobacter sp. R1 TaxID=2944934 RepID=UPI00210ABDCE|nr:HNH endonuclease [Pseudarthrobacter sp. R1]MCQ6272187.1 HNH endonuclease [Pseudarthrobacter sp. R1]
MAAVILGWNPNRRNGWDYRAAVEQVAESGWSLQRWSVGDNRNILTGTEAWLLLQGGSDACAGLIGHGVVFSEPYESVHSGDTDAPGCYVSVAFDALLPLGEQIRPDALSAAVPAIPWDDAQGRSSLAVPPGAEPDLRQLWRDYGPSTVAPQQLVSGTYPPHAVSTVEVNRYERNPDARRVCLAFHGTSCAACGFSFEASYGDIGRGFIDVHHVVPPVMLGDGYQLDPVADLVPLCPNCHAMAHRGVATPRTVSELRSIISSAGHMTGEVMSELALEAQADARRILEGRQD